LETISEATALLYLKSVKDIKDKLPLGFFVLQNSKFLQLALPRHETLKLQVLPKTEPKLILKDKLFLMEVKSENKI
jgi:hypothetical protein